MRSPFPLISCWSSFTPATGVALRPALGVPTGTIGLLRLTVVAALTLCTSLVLTSALVRIATLSTAGSQSAV